MLGDVRTRQWLPLLATGVLFVAVVYAAYAAASSTWADLAGLVYLLASPAVYRVFVAAVDAGAASSDPEEVTA